MYRNNKGLWEWSLDVNVFLQDFVKKCEVFDLSPHDVRFYSQQDEDKYIIQYILKEKITDGTFLEVGGMDGVSCSNTKTLEDYFHFSGILIEPVEKQFNEMTRNRPNCQCYNYCVSNREDNEIEYMGYNGCAGIVETIDSSSLNFIPENDREPYKVRNRKMSEIIKESGLKYIDIMSIDVEGGELSLLQSIDFTFPIYCIIIEAHSTEQEKNKIFGNYLKQNGFTYHERQRGNEVWINPDYFRRKLFNL